MNQAMHSWIAAVLGVLTVKFIIQWHRFNEKKFQWQIFIIDIVTTIIFFVIWLYYIS